MQFVFFLKVNETFEKKFVYFYRFLKKLALESDK